MHFLQERRKARPVIRMHTRPRWYVLIAVLCAPAPVLLPMYGVDQSFRFVLIASYLLGLVSAALWWWAHHRMRLWNGVVVLLAWYLLPVLSLATGAMMR